MLANATYESVTKTDKDRLLRSNPVFRFFKHVRNAASHGNRRHFSKDQPSARGEWNGFIIDDALKGASHLLHGTQCIYGTLKPADVLYLVRDVEKLL